jgi:hypothetical protein
MAMIWCMTDMAAMVITPFLKSSSSFHQAFLTINLVDIDECSSGIDLCEYNCTNSIGSYVCSCDAGYRLNADGFQCDGQ